MRTPRSDRDSGVLAVEVRNEKGSARGRERAVPGSSNGEVAEQLHCPAFVPRILRWPSHLGSATEGKPSHRSLAAECMLVRAPVQASSTALLRPRPALDFAKPNLQGLGLSKILMDPCTGVFNNGYTEKDC